jgi:quercetin dioxygenase-like cupin family protein
MPGRAVLYRWESIDLEKVTEMVSRKVIAGTQQQLIQVYLKKGALSPVHAHPGEQMIYVLQGALRALVGGEELTVREGEVLQIPANVPHQSEALDDTFVIQTRY